MRLRQRNFQDPVYQSLVKNKVFENDPAFKKIRKLNLKKEKKRKLNESLINGFWTKKEMMGNLQEFLNMTKNTFSKSETESQIKIY